MKMISFALLFVMAFNLNARVVANVHYMGDAKPIDVSIPTINNKGGTTTLENSTLIFNFEKESTLGLNADFIIDVTDNKINMTGNSINRSFIEVVTTQINNKTYTANVRFIPSDKIIAPIKNGISQLSLKNNELSFYAGDLQDEKAYTIHLKIKKKKVFKEDTIIDQDLKIQDYSINKIDDERSNIIIDLNKITADKFNINDRNTIELTTRINYDFKNIINLEQVGQKSYTKTLTTPN